MPTSTLEKRIPTAAPVNLVTKVYEPEEVNFTPGERSMVAWLTVETPDREGDIVVATGVDHKDYVAKNPIVAAFHDYGRWPVGQCKWIRLKKNKGFYGLVGKTEFDEDPDSEVVWQKVKAETVRSVSIGFLSPPDMKPGEWGPPTREEIVKNPHWAKASRIIRRCVLIEYSVVPIGMHPDALVIAVNKGFHRPPTDILAVEKTIVPDATPTDAAQVGGDDVIDTSVNDAPAIEPETKGVEVPAIEPEEPEVAAPAETPIAPSTKDLSTSTAYDVPAGSDFDDGEESDDGEVPQDLKRGDHVAISGDGHKGVGKVVSVHKDGDFVPNVEQHVIGTDDSPAARVHRYKCMGGNKYVKTGHYTGHKCMHLAKMDDDPEMMAVSRTSKSASGEPTVIAPARTASPASGQPKGNVNPAVKPTAKTVTTPRPAPTNDPLPPLVGKTDAELTLERLDALTKALDPANIERSVGDAINKKIGKI